MQSQDILDNFSKTSYHLNSEGEFVIENYNKTRPFSSFLPGIAGLYGIPMWVFYVNRGQCVTSMGITNKDNAILEFFPANRAYQLTSLQGYRTFIKILSKTSLFYEPFQNSLSGKDSQISQKMIINAHDLKLQDHNDELGILSSVEYFTLPNEDFPALARTLTIKNVSSAKMNLEVLDGLPCIISHGLVHIIQKDLSRTAEAWVEVVNVENKAPLYRLKAVIADKPEVTHIKDGHFYFNFNSRDKNSQLGVPVIDPQVIFGQASDFSYPSEFINCDKFCIPKHQRNENLTPCAFGYHNVSLDPGDSVDIYSIIGHINCVEKLNSFASESANAAYFNKKSAENKTVVDEVQENINTVSSSKEFDLYVKQTFLDNVLRGGLPITFESNGSKNIFHVYSRKHGDLERDYNKFSILPTPFSQGNGNYRDINQNRRSDVWFNPDVCWSNIESFVNLIQLDGYNPLVIKGASFTCKNTESLLKALDECINDKTAAEDLQACLFRPFTPGGLLKKISDENIRLKTDKRSFLNRVISVSEKSEEAEHGEGFWTDHWTYNLDQIESFLAVYPDKLKELLLEKNDFFFYANKAAVAPRSKRYILRFGRPFQAYSIENISDQDEWRKKEETMQGVDANLFKVKKQDGSVYNTRLISKLICIITNKIATLDPHGVGIAMEAGKPNWYDALNGLPGMFGSSLNETIELKRLSVFVLDSIIKLKLADDYKISFPSELYLFLKEINELLKNYPGSDDESACFEFWDKSNSIKEHYRNSIKNGISGEELGYRVGEIKSFLIRVTAKIEAGIDKALDKQTGLYKSYFYHEMSEYEEVADPVSDKPLLSQDGFPYIKPKKFIQKALPFFLEGQVHAFKILDSAGAHKLYQSVKASQLYDKELNMYKVNAPLAGEPEEIGRCRLFTPGWLENESIWLHMEYKFLLELLESSLYDDFYAEFRKILVPFLNASIYGRSILENSSFISSSANPDKSARGCGYVARLSGSTAELVNIWTMMTLGLKPFSLDSSGNLKMELKPILPEWLFTNEESAQEINHATINIPKNSFLCRVFGRTNLLYKNPARKNTYGNGGACVKNMKLTFSNGSSAQVSGGILDEKLSVALRNGEVRFIEAELG